MRVGINVGVACDSRVHQVTKALIAALERLDRTGEYYLLAANRPTPPWWWEQVLIPQRAARVNLDILHQRTPFVPRWFGGATVVSVHRVPRVGMSLPLPLVASAFRLADHFIAPSQAVKGALVATYQLSEDRVTVVHEAPRPAYRPVTDRHKLQVVKKRYQTGDRFLLVMADPSRLHLVKSVVAEVRRRIRQPWRMVVLSPGVQVIELGGGPERDVVLCQPDIRDEPALCSAAAAVLVFGCAPEMLAQAMEAMQCGTPVVTDCTQESTELVSTGGLLVSPGDVADWARALVSIMTDTAARSELSHRALRQAKRFSWMRTAKETLKVYERVHAHRERRSRRARRSTAAILRA